MNISAPIAQTISSAHREAFAKVDAWRGQCVRHFAKLEQAIARFMAQHDPKALAAGHGLGCRLKQLEVFLDEAPPATNSLVKALSDLEKRKASRDAIVHGDGIIYVSIRGDWLWECEVLNARKPELVRHPFRMAEAEKFENDLKRGVQRVCALLDAYRPKCLPPQQPPN